MVSWCLTESGISKNLQTLAFNIREMETFTYFLNAFNSLDSDFYLKDAIFFRKVQRMITLVSECLP